MAVKKFDVMNLGKAGLLNPEQVGYKDSIEIIKDESLRVQKSFVKIGWYLKHIRDNELFKEDGYASIWECAADQLGYSQSTASRFINICEKFSKNHNSPELDIKYAGFDKSQMIEMLPMEPEQLEKVVPEMTVKQIRDIKTNDKLPKTAENDADIPGQTSIEKDFPEYMPEKQEEDLKKEKTEVYATSHKEECFALADEEKIIDGEYHEIEEPAEEVHVTEERLSPYGLPKTSYSEESLITTVGVGCGHKYYCFSCAQDCTIRQKDRYCREASLGNPFSCTTMHVLENVRAEQPDGQCQFINLDMAEHTLGKDPEPCCKNCDNESCGYRCQRSINKVNTEAADSDLMPKDGLAVTKYILKQENKILDDMLKFNDLPEMTVLKQKTIVAALAAMVCDLEAAESAPEPEPQPELPILKNNDQRKQWLEAYKTWGLWYRDENIDVNYYKYDFEDGSRLVVAEYLQRQDYYKKNKAEDEHFYHLLQIGKEGYKFKYNEKYRNSTDSETYLVDFLKNLQKRNLPVPDDKFFND